MLILLDDWLSSSSIKYDTRKRKVKVINKIWEIIKRKGLTARVQFKDK
jgi:hypothetical protein